MTRFTSAFGIAAAVSVTASLAAANTYDTVRLLTSGAWDVDMTHNTQTGDLWCQVGSENAAGQSFSLVAFSNNQLSLFILDDGWDLGNRRVDFIVDIDQLRWEIEGIGSGVSVSTEMSDPIQAATFVGELTEGNQISILSVAEDRLMQFSLDGFPVAVNSMIDCWAAISVPGATPDANLPPVH